MSVWYSPREEISGFEMKINVSESGFFGLFLTHASVHRQKAQKWSLEQYFFKRYIHVIYLPVKYAY